MKHVTILHIILTINLLIAGPLFAADEDSALQAVDRSIRLRDYAQAILQLESLVQMNNPRAQYRLAGLYRSGQGVKKDLKKSLALYQSAAEQGLAEAQYTLASLLEKQSSSKQDQASILNWYQSAADQNHPLAIKKLNKLKSQTPSENITDTSEDNIFAAIRNNDIASIRAMIRADINLNISDSQGRSTLLAALLAEHHDMSRLLLTISTQSDQADMDQNRPLLIATRHGYVDIAQTLLENNVNIDAVDSLGNTALMIATRHQDEALIDLLLRYKANPFIRNKKQQTALDMIQNLSLSKAEKQYMRHGINLNNQSQRAQIDIDSFHKNIQQSGSIYKGWPPLNVASLLGETEIMQALISKRANVNARDPAGNSPLHRAAGKGQLEAARLLIENGASINAVNHDNETPLYMAARAGQDELVSLLLDANADTSIKARNENSPLSIAISNQHPDSARLLAKENLDDNAIHTALMAAILQKMENVSMLLIPRDASINVTDPNQRTLLWHSSDLGLTRTTEALLKSSGIDINLADNKGYSPLARAVQRGYTDIATRLIDKGANTSTLTLENNTLLMLAVLSKKSALIEKLLLQPVNINAKNKNGDTALMMASANGQAQTVEILIKAGADLHTRNHDDENAYQMANKNGHQHIAEMIRNHSGKLFKLLN